MGIDNIQIRVNAFTRSGARQSVDSPQILNTTTSPARFRISSTYGEAQRKRVAQATAERHRAGIPWRATPSEHFDWDRAIAGLRRILQEVYE